MPDSSRRKSSTAFSMRTLACATASLLVAIVLITEFTPVWFPATQSARRHQRSHLLPQHDPLDVSRFVEIENNDGHLVFHAQRDGRGIHHRQAALQHVQITDAVEAFGARY